MNFLKGEKMEEEKEFLESISKKVEKVIEKEAARYNYDLAYFGFKLTCSKKGEHFEKVEEKVLLDTSEKAYCAFCGKETYYYDSEKDMHLCPECFAKIGRSN